MVYKVLLIVIPIVLVALTVYLSYLIIKSVNPKSILKQGYDMVSEKAKEASINRAISQYTKNISHKMSFAERIELYYLDKSNVRKYLPNFTYLMLLMVLLVVIIFPIVNSLLMFIPSSLIISLVVAISFPLLILEYIAKKNAVHVRRKLADTISVLNRWATVREDIFFAFEKAVGYRADINKFVDKECVLDEPLKTYVKEMIIQIKSGVDPLLCLDILGMKVDNEQFKDFVINIKQNIRSRGNTVKLLTNLEEQFMKIEHEFENRKISTLSDRVLIYVFMSAVLIIGFIFLKMNPSIAHFYLHTDVGKWIFSGFCCLYGLGIYFSFQISKFNY